MDPRSQVLIVDDTPENLTLISVLLKGTYRTRVAISGIRALALVEINPQPDLILLDIMMPEMDGYEVCRRLKTNPATAHIPVIFLTALNEAEHERKGLELGAVDYITKPVNPPILLARVATHVALKHSRDEIVEARDRAEQALTELKAMQEHLIQAEKLAALAGLVAGVAHEINTPIGIAVTAASTLNDETVAIQALIDASQAKKSQVLAYFGTARESSDLVIRHCLRAASLIKSFKQIAVDQTSDEMRPLDLCDYLRETVTSLGPELKKNGAVVAIDAPGVIMAEIFPGALCQIVTNLIMNSLIHGLDEGRRPGEIGVSLRREPGSKTVELRHHDTGLGIAANIAPRIFEPFFTTRRGRGGSGLGLGIVHNLVTQRLGGTIRHEDTPGGGATFIIRFPG
ncbi:histidine kinase [uncultured Gammaproteobacteria bacterium]